MINKKAFAAKKNMLHIFQIATINLVSPSYLYLSPKTPLRQMTKEAKAYLPPLRILYHTNDVTWQTNDPPNTQHNPPHCLPE